MKRYAQEQLNEILKKHKKWLDNEDGGERADLTNANLTYANLTNANLTYANLTNANLTYADLTNANLTNANLTNANLTNANLKHADLTYADLTNADLTNADLKRANLTNANLTCAKLKHTDLTYADLDFSSFPLWCGSLKAQLDDRLIIQLLYHLLSAAKYSKNISAEIKQTLLCDDLICIANKFHRVSECGMISGRNQNV